MNIYLFPSIFHFFPTKGTFSPDTPSFSPHAISKFRNIMKLTAGFKVCPPSVLGYVGYFVRAVFTEMGKREGGKCEFSGEKVKTPGKKNSSLPHCWDIYTISHPTDL